VGLFKRKDSRFWWMGYTLSGEHHYESTKTTSQELAAKIWKHRESEITLGLFRVGWLGERITFGQLCDEFERSHFAGLAENTVRGHHTYIKHLEAFFEDCKLDKISAEMVEKYRDQRRQQPTRQDPNRTVKGATVNRELECLKCVLDLAVKRKYIAENPALEVSHFNELRERPVRRMLTVEEELRILEAAPPYLRVAMILLTQTGGRTYSEGFSLRWNQVDLEHRVIRLDNNVKTPGSVEPIPLSDYACEVLKAWRKEQASTNPFVFPSPIRSDRPISTVKTVWKSTLKRAGVPHFPLYNLRHVFCTRLSGVAPDAVVQRAMRHTSPETKRRYQLGMADQVRKAVEEANKSTYGKKNVLRFYYGQPQTDDGQQNAAAN
jgi:integrase